MSSRFVCPVFAERSPVELRVVTAQGEQVIQVPTEHVVYVSGLAAELVALERTAASVVIRAAKGASFDVTEPSSIVVEPDFDAFTKRVLAAPHRAVFDAIVVGACAWGLDISLPVAGRVWSASKGAPLSDADVTRLIALVKQEADLVDPDRFASQSELRSLDAIDAALVGDGPRLVRQAVSASHDEPAKKRWLSVLSSALERLASSLAMDPIAVDVLACALRPRGALDEPVAPKREPPSTPPRVITVRIGSSKLTLIETAGGYAARYRVEIDGAKRRVRSRITYQDGWTGKEETAGWTEGEDADLSKLVKCLELGVKPVESSGRLELDLEIEGLATLTDAERTRIVVDFANADAVVVDIHYYHRSGSWY